MDVLNALNQIFFVFWLVGPVVMGAYLVLFNRRFTLQAIRQQNALWKRTPWKIRFSERWIPFYRVFAVFGGTVLFVAGLANAAQFLLR